MPTGPTKDLLQKSSKIKLFPNIKGLYDLKKKDVADSNQQQNRRNSGSSEIICSELQWSLNINACSSRKCSLLNSYNLLVKSYT